MKPFDIKKLSSALAKKNSNIQLGFTDPKVWISTGNYALNYRISSDFFKGFPLEGKMTLIAGESSTGKSYLASGNVVRWCQQNGVTVFIFDTERAIDNKWIRALGVDPEADNVTKYNISLIDDITSTLMEILKQYKEAYLDADPEDRPPILIDIDSLGMATTATEIKHAEDGQNKGDMGLKQKQLFNMCRTFLASVGEMPIGMICTQHTYASQDIYKPDSIISGGSSLEFTPSVVIAMKKKKMKEDDQGKKLDEVAGVHVSAVVRKSRYGKPYQEVEFNIPYDTGMNPYSGLFELFTESLKMDGRFVLTKAGAYVDYVDPNGEVVFHKYRSKITNEDYDRIMKDFMDYTTKHPHEDVSISPESLEEGAE